MDSASVGSCEFQAVAFGRVLTATAHPHIRTTLFATFESHVGVALDSLAKDVIGDPFELEGRCFLVLEVLERNSSSEHAVQLADKGVSDLC